MREFEMTPREIVVGGRLRGYRGLATGIPTPLSREADESSGEAPIF